MSNTYKINCFKSLILILLAIFVSLTLIIGVSEAADIEAGQETARPSVNGRLHVKDVGLADESGNPVQLRGVSTHGLTYYPEFISESLFHQVSEDWNCSLIRLAMYSSLYCADQKEESLRLMKQGIEAAIAEDMYILVDWHILEDSDPNQHADNAVSRNQAGTALLTSNQHQPGFPASRNMGSVMLCGTFHIKQSPPPFLYPNTIRYTPLRTGT